MSGPLVWEALPTVDDRPTYGPACPGYETHAWTLHVEDGETWLHSGCEECDFHLESHEVAAELTGWLMFDHEHKGRICPNFMGQCDCNYWYRFTPGPTFPDIWSAVAKILTGTDDPSSIDSAFTIEDIAKAVWSLLHPEVRT